MKKKNLINIAVILLVGVFLLVLTEFESLGDSIPFLFAALLAFYLLGRYVEKKFGGN